MIYVILSCLILLFQVVLQESTSLENVYKSKKGEEKKIALTLDCTNAQWGPWRCPGFDDICKSDSNATRYKCLEGDCVLGSMCSNREQNRQTVSCQIIKRELRCKPWWSSWNHWSSCSTTCGFTEKFRTRTCYGVRHPGVIKSTCADIKSMEQFLTGGGFVQRNACPLRHMCPAVNGGWGHWGSYTPCSVTCGVGARSRNRQCNNPRRKGTGMNCTGLSIQRTECYVDVSCPQQGQWCPWSRVDKCSELCGGGIGKRRRRCVCPPPSHDGSYCYGLKIITDVCNVRPCPYNKELTLREVQILTNDLSLNSQRNIWEYSGGNVPRVGDVVTFQCPKTLQSRKNIFEKKYRFPKHKIHWKFGNSILKESKAVFINDEYLMLRGVNLDQAGFYSLVFEHDPGLFNTVCFYPLYIQGNSMTVNIGESFKFNCNSAYFDQFVSISQLGSWTSNWIFEPDKVSLELGAQQDRDLWPSNSKTLPFNASTLHIVEEVNDHMSGLYTCQVVNTPKKFSPRVFITQQFRLTIVSSSSFLAKFRKYLKGNATVSFIMVTTGVIVTLLYAIYMNHRAKWEARNILKKHYNACCTLEKSNKMKI